MTVVYSPPPSQADGFRNSLFFEKYNYLENLAILPEDLIITGDFKIHLDDSNNTEAEKLLRVLEEHGLSKHVRGATHIRGHILGCGVFKYAIEFNRSSIKDCFPPSTDFEVRKLIMNLDSKFCELYPTLVLKL